MSASSVCRRTASRLAAVAGVGAMCVAMSCAAIKPAAIVEQFNEGATATDVRLAVGRFHEALKRRDINSVLDMFVADTTFRAFDGVDGWLTYDNLRLQDAIDFRRLRTFDIALDSINISVLDPSAAVVSSNLRESYSDSAGHERRYRVTQTMVWTRRATGWKIAHLHSSERPDTMP